MTGGVAQHTLLPLPYSRLLSAPPHTSLHTPPWSSSPPPTQTSAWGVPLP